MHLGDAAEQIVEVAHDILIGPDHEHADVIHLAGRDAMERQRFLHVLEINELGDFAVGVAGNVHYRAVPVWRRSEPMDGHDREKLPERPMIEQRLEHREVANVLIGQGDFEVLHLVRHITQAAMHVDDLMRDLPVNGVDLRFGFEIEQTKIERLLRFLLYLLNVVKAFQAISTLQTLRHVHAVANPCSSLISYYSLVTRLDLL